MSKLKDKRAKLQIKVQNQGWTPIFEFYLVTFTFAF